MKGLAVARARERLLALDGAEASANAVCAGVMDALHQVVNFTAAALLTTDPETMLPSGGVVEGFEPSACVPFWDNELVDPDFNKFTDLARRADPIATLSDAVDGDFSRSPRYQKLYRAMDPGDELRVAFVTGSWCTAVAVMLSPTGAGFYTDDDLAAVRELMPLATNVLRRAAGRLHHRTSMRAPAVIMLDGSGAVTGMTAGARAILDELRGELDTDELPTMVAAAATRARWSRSSINLTTRLRGRDGEWLRLHVAPMEGEVGAVALTVEPARPDDLVLILLDSYGLTERETEIALLLSRGLATKEIAAELIISVHTVRDHVKAIFEKAGVNSRGELLATLFSNHVLEGFHSSVTRVQVPHR